MADRPFMPERKQYLFGAMALVLLCAACKPPPSDAEINRATSEPEPVFASTPLASPDTTDAVWASSSDGERIVYGVPGEAALIALECVREDAEPHSLRITRFALADEGAEALMALIGNGYMSRLPVDAEIVAERLAWQGTHGADAEFWEPLAGPRGLTATVPGAGKVSLGPSPLPGELIAACRSG